MRERWKTKKLSEVFQIKPPKSEARKKLNEQDLVSFVPMNDLGENKKFFAVIEKRTLAEVSGSYTYFADNDVLLAKITPCFENGKLGIAKNLKNGIGFGSSEYIVFRPTGCLIPEFLYYFLSQDSFREEGKRVMSGAVGHKRVPKDLIENYKIPVPSLPEQQGIVAILDEAFADIATATANARKNLQNARELFESHLQAVFTKKGAGWMDSVIENHIRFIDYRGRTPKKTEHGMRLITAKNVKMGFLQLEPREFVNPEIYDDWMTRGIPKKGDILFTTEAPLGNVAQLDTDEKVVFAQRVIIMQPNDDELDKTFLKYLLLSNPMQKRIHEKGTGLTATGIKAKLLKKVEISFPKTLTVQKAIIAKLDSLSTETQRLEAIYQQKLNDLSELKQAILQKAFAGELSDQSRKASIIPFPQKVPNINTTDLHAGILAIAYEHHEGTKHEKLFGHVKAEKIAHMVEARVGIDLERNPFKDAAGPNDTPRLKKVEHRARKAGYFDFREKKNGPHEFHKLNGFEKLIEKTRFALAEKNQALDELLHLMLPMNRYWAEIFTTLYAAWNNLLLDKKPITDEAIVYEAREDWHPEKLKIPRNDFLRALTRMKKRNYIPKGKGGKVSSRDKKRNERN